jgi:hypothetical protein
MSIRLAIALAQHPDAQRACIIVQAEGVGDMWRAFGFDGVEDDGARGEAVEDQVVERKSASMCRRPAAERRRMYRDDDSA